jgi:hypothetical protein
VAPEDYKKIRSKRNNKFYYINDDLAPDYCAGPPTIEEKVEQQDGRKHHELLSDELDGFRNSPYNRAIRGTWAERYIGARKLHDWLAPIRHPKSIGWHLRKIRKIKAKAEDWQHVYHGDGTNGDEADAFRHFIWIVFMSYELGLGEAEKIATLHELDDVSMDSMMDRYNNMIALREAKRLIQNGQKLTDKEICDLAMQFIKNRTLVVVKSYNGNPDVATVDNNPAFQKWAHHLLEKKLR